jgi:hypothetical protein
VTDRDNLLTGSLLLRSTEEDPSDGTDRDVYVVFGVVAVPKGSGWKPEHLVPVVGYDGGQTLTLCLGSEVEPDMPPGCTPNQALMAKIWKV